MDYISRPLTLSIGNNVNQEILDALLHDHEACIQAGPAKVVKEAPKAAVGYVAFAILVLQGCRTACPGSSTHP